MEELVKRLLDLGVLKSPRIADAFLAVNRAYFVPSNLREEAYIDEALPIGGGQTISQPYTVAFMLELLSPRPGEVILDIGSGSGWQTAILAYIISENSKFKNQNAKLQFKIKNLNLGKIYAIEIIPEICELGKQNVGKYNFVESDIVEFHCGNGDKAVVGGGEADRIIAAASIACDKDDMIDCVPGSWKSQLKIGGIIVTPIGNSIWKFTKIAENKFESEEHPGFMFVPYV